jgi:hypothetical protein
MEREIRMSLFSPMLSDGQLLENPRSHFTSLSPFMEIMDRFREGYSRAKTPGDKVQDVQQSYIVLKITVGERIRNTILSHIHRHQRRHPCSILSGHGILAMFSQHKRKNRGLCLSTSHLWLLTNYDEIMGSHLIVTSGDPVSIF